MAKRNSNVVGIRSGRDERDEALRFASLHVLSILDALPVLLAMECGEEETPDCFRGHDWSDV